jgi:hypothetical protein
VVLIIYKVLKFLHCAEQNIQSSRIFARAECNRIFTLYIDKINKKKFVELYNKDCSENYYSEKDSSYTYINIVYNYHLGHILNNLTEIRKKLDIIF